MLSELSNQLFHSSIHFIIRLSLILIALLFNVHHTIAQNHQKKFIVNNYYTNVPIQTFHAPLSNIAFTNITGRMFVAGLNYLYLVQDNYPDLNKFNIYYLNESRSSKNVTLPSYKNMDFFSSSFKILDAFQTNKEFDKNFCIYSNECKYSDTIDINNENRILLSATKLNSLFFVCGTAYGGLCFIANENDGKIKARIYANETYKTNYVASKKSSVMIRGVYDKKPIFYVAFEPDDRPINYQPPIFSARIFKKNTYSNNSLNLDYQFNQDGQITSINIKKLDYFDTNFRFIYGFIYEKFAFILKTQPFYKTQETRLGKVCTKDSSFFSYSEISLRCQHENKLYDYAITADFGRADNNIFNKLNIKKKDSVLYVIFASYNQNEEKINQENSILCAFSIEKILEHYLRTINSCMDGLTHISNKMVQYSALEINQECVAAKKDSDYFCFGSNLNPYIQSSEYLEGTFLYKFNDYVTSFKTSLIKTDQDSINNKGYFIAGLGTLKGDMFKLFRSGDGSNLIESSKIKINPIKNVLIQPNPALSEKSEFVYFVGEKNLAKFPLKSCLLYSTCDECLSVKDSLGCAWCNLVDEGRGFCSTRNECLDLNETKTYLSYYECPPIMFNFNPIKGPIEGGTKITIEGENLCSYSHIHGRVNSNLKLSVTIGSVNCLPHECKDKKLICETIASGKNFSSLLKVMTKDKTHDKYDVNGITFIPNHNFSFVQTKVVDIKPNYGPMFGGTKIIFEGEHLDSGLEIKITIGGIICEIIEKSNEFLICKSGRLYINNNEDEMLDSFNKNSEIILEIDSNKFRIDRPESNNLKFIYKENPISYSIKPNAMLRLGKSNITVYGKYYSSVHRIELKVNFFYTGKNYELIEKCELIDLDENNSYNSTLSCLIPSIPDDVKIDRVTTPLITELQVTMDGESIYNKNNKIFRFLYYPIPNIKKKTKIETIFLDKNGNGQIEIKGNDFSTEYFFTIYLEEIKSGKKFKNKRDLAFKRVIPCTNKELQNSRLLRCKISTSNLDENFINSKWLIKLIFNDNYQPDVGLIQFSYETLTYNWLTWIAIVLCVFLIVFLLTSLSISNGYLKYEKKFPNIFIKYNKKGPMMNGTSVLDSAYSRQSQQNDYHNGKDTNTPLLGFLIDKKQSENISSYIKEVLAKENLLIPQNYLKLHEKIGKGYFGCVYKGTLKVPMQEMPMQVAVKTLKNENVENSDNINSFLEEALRMKEFKHENVLTLLGVCLQEDSLPFIVLPFMANGDLASYIRLETNYPSVRNLLFYAIDVGNGMSYLSSIKFVHRDLAARNCMMDGNLRIKVADFGLSRDIYERNYYTSKRRAEIPIKWMAPECIEKGIATIESDVWSYGVLLWELMTRGNNPYPLFENHQVIDFIKAGVRMQRPETCPLEIYELMLDCWQMLPRLRPTFNEIVARIKEFIVKKERFAISELNINAELTVKYVNYPIEQYYNTFDAKSKYSLETAQCSSTPNNLSTNSNTFSINPNLSNSNYLNEISNPELQIYHELELPGKKV